jgi:hypothetical protein
MTTPVAALELAGGHTVTFVMPKGRSLESLPVPLDIRVQLRDLPERRVAVLRFTGSYKWEPVRAKMRELMARIEQEGMARRRRTAVGGMIRRGPFRFCAGTKCGSRSRTMELARTAADLTLTRGGKSRVA